MPLQGSWFLNLVSETGLYPKPQVLWPYLITGKILIHATGNLWDVGILQIPYRVTIEILGYPPFRRLHFGLRDLILCGEKAEISRWCGCSHGRRNGVYQGTHKGPTSLGHDRCIQKISNRRCMNILDPSPWIWRDAGLPYLKLLVHLCPADLWWPRMYSSQFQLQTISMHGILLIYVSHYSTPILSNMTHRCM